LGVPPLSEKAFGVLCELLRAVVRGLEGDEGSTSGTLRAKRSGGRFALNAGVLQDLARGTLESMAS
jgi:hypothetical protein